jgi:hypothetical protein
VFSFGVIEHVSFPREFLKKQRKRVADHGTVVIATPEASGLDLQNPDVLLMHQPYHRHILSHRALKALAKEEGLSLIRSENRNWMDTRHPGLNGRFIADYISATGGFVDALFERRQVGRFLSSPRLWISFWLGYYFPKPGYMVCQFEPAKT